MIFLEATVQTDSICDPNSQYSIVSSKSSFGKLIETMAYGLALNIGMESEYDNKNKTVCHCVDSNCILNITETLDWTELKWSDCNFNTVKSIFKDEKIDCLR